MDDVFGTISQTLHFSPITSDCCRWWLRLPTGLPTAGMEFRAGVFTSRPGYLPVVIQFEDWDLFHVHAGRVTFEWSTGHRLHARPGDFCFLPPLTAARVVGRTAKVSFGFCHFDFRDPPVAADDRQARQEQEPPCVPICFRAKDAPAVAKAFLALEQGHASPAATDWPAGWDREMQVIRLIGAMAAWGKAQRKRSPDHVEMLERRHGVMHDSRLRRVLRQIESQPQRNWSIPELAASVGVSAGHLHALARSTLGMSLKRHMVMARLRKAIILMKQPTPAGARPLKEVARLAGFSSQHFLTRQFHQHYGMPPGEYRRSNGLL